MSNDSVVNVSPATGTREVRVTRSTFRDPMTDMMAGLEAMMSVAGWVLGSYEIVRYQVTILVGYARLYWGLMPVATFFISMDCI